MAEQKGIQARDDQIEKFLQSNSSLVNSISAGMSNKPPKPVAFSFAQKGNRTVTKPTKRTWGNLIESVCLLMGELHPEDFDKTLLSMSDWFGCPTSEPPNGYHKAIGNTGLWVKYADSANATSLCHMVAERFGYAPESLSILESN